jgi:hypothetical protein
MEDNLVYISSNLGLTLKYIMKLEKQNISLCEVLSAVKYVRNKLNYYEGGIGVEVFQTFNNVSEKNSGFKAILKISKMLTGKETSIENLSDD